MVLFPSPAALSICGIKYEYGEKNKGRNVIGKGKWKVEGGRLPKEQILMYVQFLGWGGEAWCFRPSIGLDPWGGGMEKEVMFISG